MVNCFEEKLFMLYVLITFTMKTSDSPHIFRPDFAAAWMNLGIVLTQLKQFKDAERCYWNAIKYRRNYPDCFYNLGNLVSW